MVLDQFLTQRFLNGRVDALVWLLYAQQLFVWFYQDLRERLSGRIVEKIHPLKSVCL